MASSATGSWMGRRWRRMLRPPRRAIPTRPGLFALGAPIFLGMAAVTSNNNLLFMVLGATLGALVVSGVLSERVVRPLEAKVSALGPLYAGEPAPLQVELRRDDGPPVFDLRFRETAPWRWRKPPVSRLDLRFAVMEGARVRLTGARCFDTRGRVRLEPCEVSTRYPFGLLVKAKDVDPGFEAWVRPRRVEAPPELRRPKRGLGQGTAVPRRGLGLDLYGLRERTERDPAHRVHALRSLALGREVVLQMTDEQRPTAWLGIASTPEASREALERALEWAQAVLLAWEEAGFAVGLSSTSAELAPGRHDLSALLEHLARLEPAPPEGRWSSGPSLWLVPEGVKPPPTGEAWRVDPEGPPRPWGTSA